MASVLDTFVLLFKSDVSGAQKPVEQTDKAVQELDEHVKEASKSTEILNDWFGELGGTVLKTMAAFVAADAIIDGVFENAERIDALGKFSHSINESSEDVEAWGQAVGRSGGTAEGFQATLGGLAREMATVATKGESRLTPYFEKLGINLLDVNGKARSTLEILPELADKFQGMSKIESRGLGEKIGLDEGTILLLQQGRGAVEELVARQKALGVATDEDIEKAEKFNDQWDDTKQMLRSLGVEIGGGILPAFTAILKGFERIVAFAKDNKPFVVSLFTGLAAVILYTYTPAVIEAAVATWAMMAPFLAVAIPIAALVALFALIADDIYNFVTGGDSLIGNLLEWVNSFELVRAAVNFAKAALGALWDKATEFVKGSSTIQGAIKLVSMAFEGWKLIIDGIVDAFNWLVSKGSQVASLVGSILGAGAHDVAVALNQGAATLNAASASPINSQTSTSVSTSSRQISKDQSVNIQTLQVQTQATDADGISRSIGVSLKGQMREAVSNFDDGVAN